MGLDQLVAAIPLLCRAVPDVLVHLAGRGSLAADLERRRHDSGLERHLRLVGYLPDELLPIAYRAADLTVVPSVALEGFGLVVAESLASGTPALVSDIGGLPEVVGGIAPQCVVPDASAASWALALADALLGRLQIPPPAALAAHVRATFDWSVVAPRITAIYREAAA
jgi:glycosyltransferase involved in cell wall biosynthesis